MNVGNKSYNHQQTKSRFTPLNLKASVEAKKPKKPINAPVKLSQQSTSRYMSGVTSGSRNPNPRPIRKSGISNKTPCMP